MRFFTDHRNPSNPAPSQRNAIRWAPQQAGCTPPRNCKKSVPLWACRATSASGSARDARFVTSSLLKRLSLLLFPPLGPTIVKTRKWLIGLTALSVLSTIVVLQARTSATSSASDDSAVTAPQQVSTTLKYWKGNLHTHSFWSDGDDFPEMIADWYKRHGYHFLALSDHNILSEGDRWISAQTMLDPAKKTVPPRMLRQQVVRKYLDRFGSAWVELRQAGDQQQVRLKPLREFRSILEETGRYLMIPAEEITHQYAKAPVHINAVNLRDVIRPVDGPSIAETMSVNLRLVSEQEKKTGWKTIAFLNHPNFKWGINAEHMVLSEELKFFEVFNGHPGVNNYGDEVYAGCELIWDIVLALRLGKLRLPVVYGLATDDAHNYHEYAVGKVNPGRGWVMVQAPYLSAESIVRSMEAGTFYSSTGVLLSEIRRQGDDLNISIQGQPGVKYKTQFIATLRDTSFDSEPVLDKNGQPLEVTRLYSKEIGKVVAESDDLNPTYKMSRNELYVRAKITSDKPHPNPFKKDDVQVAWTQPFLP